ncbi:MAG: PLDc N-terminal domain-containing protein, partial [Myxococcota bacterium]
MAELWPWIEARWFWIDLGAQLLAIVSVPSVILQRRGRPMAALSWILCLLSFPALGLFLWWLIGRNHLARPRRRRHLTAATMNDQLEDLRGSLGLESEASSSSLAPPRAGELLSAVPLQLADTV